MSNTHNVEIVYNGETKAFSAPEDKTILEAAADAGIELPSSCLSGVCTTCAGKVVSGEIHDPDAMGVSPELKEKGFTLLCMAFARSDMKIEAGQEDQLYELQFGQFQK